MLASDIFRVIFGLVAVLGMIGVCAYLARKTGFSNLATAAGKKRRLSESATRAMISRKRVLPQIRPCL